MAAALVFGGASGASAANVDDAVGPSKRPPDMYDTLQRMQNDPGVRDALQKLRDAGQELRKDQGLRDALGQALKAAHVVPTPCLMGTITTGGTTAYYVSSVLMFASSEAAQSTLHEYAPRLSRHHYELYYPEYERFVIEGGLDHLKDPSWQQDRATFAKVVEAQRTFYGRLAAKFGRKPEVLERLRRLVPEGTLKDASLRNGVTLSVPQGCEVYSPDK